MATQTPNFNFELPEVGGDVDQWGDFLNINWSALDTLLIGYLPLAGGTVTGQIALPGGGTGLEALTSDEIIALDDIVAGLANAAQATADLALPLAGGTLTGDLVIEKNFPTIYINSTFAPVTDQNDWWITSDGAFLTINSVDDGGSGQAGAYQFQRDADGLVDSFFTGGSGYSITPPAAGSILNRERGDGRYLPLVDPVTEGALTIGEEVILGVEVLVEAANTPCSMAGASRKTLEVTGATIIDVTGGVPNQTVEILITQSATPGTVTFSGVVAWIGGVVPVISENIGALDIITLTTTASGANVIGQYVGSTLP